MYKISKRLVKKYSDGWLRSEVINDELIKRVKEKVTDDMDGDFYLGFASGLYLALDVYDRAGDDKKGYETVIIHLVARACNLIERLNGNGTQKIIPCMPIYL